MARSEKHAAVKHKTQPRALPGAVSPLYTRCGKTNCHCQNGHLHGPYFRRQWYEGGRLRSAYVRRRDVEQVKAACAVYRREQQEAKAQQRVIEELFWYEFREMRQELRELYGRYGWKG